MEMADKFITLYGTINGFDTGMKSISQKVIKLNYRPISMPSILNIY
jgi:hypothetical protein